MAEERTSVEDATRRTRLANERTFLAWWRTGLTAFAVGLGAGRVVPELSHHGADWPYEVVGAAFGVVGIAMIAYSFVRQRAVDQALDRGSFASFPASAAFVFAFVGMLLGVGTVLVVVLHPT